MIINVAKSSLRSLFAVRFARILLRFNGKVSSAQSRPAGQVTTEQLRPAS